jgi:hypothetical protein
VRTIKCVDNQHFIKTGNEPDAKEKQDIDCNWHQAKLYKNNTV